MSGLGCNAHADACFISPDRAIPKNGNTDWPPSSCDVTLLFFLGFLKDSAYYEKPETIQQGKDNFREGSADKFATIWDFVIKKNGLFCFMS